MQTKARGKECRLTAEGNGEEAETWTYIILDGGHKLPYNSINVLWHLTSTYLNDPFTLSWDDLWPSPAGGHWTRMTRLFSFTAWPFFLSCARGTFSITDFSFIPVVFLVIFWVNSFPFLILFMSFLQSYYSSKRQENHIRNDAPLYSWRGRKSVVYVSPPSAVPEEILLEYFRSTSFADVALVSW